MRKTVGLILAGGRVEDLSVLTERRPKSAVVFGGIYRTIDFALTNLANAGVGTVGILVQYRPSSLMDHVGTGMAWDLVGTTRGVRFLPPYLKSTISEQYRGPADAMYQNLDLIERSGADDVLTVSGDHVYAMDYRPLLNFHHEHGADLTMAFVPVDVGAQRFGIGELTADGQIMNLAEKPANPRTNFASMSVYCFRREVLVEELRTAIKGESAEVTFQIHEVIRRMISHCRAYGYVYHGPWFYTRTLDEYVSLHRELLAPSPRVNLAGVRSNIMAGRVAPPAPTHFLPGAEVEESLVSAGCLIQGMVQRSVLSPGVRVAKGAVVRDSVLWDDVVVEEGAVLEGVVCDKRTVFGRGAHVGVGELKPSKELPGSLTCGAAVLGAAVHVPPDALIGKNCIIHPECQADDLRTPVGSGESVWPTSIKKEATP
jgi:glucose-1-phosphate adenylyltransferase